jgi:Zn-dependent protease with chaperone function
MSSLPVEAFRLKDISPKAYEHPADRAATAALASIPYLDPLVRKLISLGYERALRSEMLGGSIRLGEDQLPRVWALHRQAYDVLDVAPLPKLYVTQFPFANAMAVGSKDPVVVVYSETVSLLDDDGMRAVLGHEAGHVLSDHGLYRTALWILMRVARLPLVGLPLGAVRMALMEWYRAGELSCDRAAALVTRDPEAICRALMALSAGVPADQLNLAAFLRQADEFGSGADGLEWLSRRSLELRQETHPLGVSRAKELMDWVRSGEYDRIVGGEYMRRGEEPPARESAADAVDHYSERFKDAFADVTDQLDKAGKQVSDWLVSGSSWVRAAKPRRGGGTATTDAPPADAPADDEPLS